MKLCTSCRRHVRPAERACPFCGEALHADEAPRFGAMVLIGALAAACGPESKNESASGGESSGGETAGASTSTAGATTSGTSPGTSAGSSTTGTGMTGTVSSTGELTSSNDVDGNDAGCSFYGGCPIDAGNPNECDQWVQDCAEGEKCMPWSSDGDSSWDALKCVPLFPEPDQPGEPCTVEGSGVSGIDSCAVGAMCWDVDEQTKQGTCVAMCKGSPDQPTCAEPDESCLIGNDGVLSLCLPTCDPMMSECAEGELCVPNLTDPDRFICLFDGSGDEGQEFDDCGAPNSCDPGLFCGSSDLAVECERAGFACCLAFCDLDMPACVGEGAECVPWFQDGMAPEGLEDVGACAIPQ